MSRLFFTKINPTTTENKGARKPVTNFFSLNKKNSSIICANTVNERHWHLFPTGEVHDTIKIAMTMAIFLPSTAALFQQHLEGPSEASAEERVKKKV